MDPDEVFKQGITKTKAVGNATGENLSRTFGLISGKSPKQPRVVEFTVCIPAMFKFGNAAQLVEKLEMLRILGAGRVVLYKTSVQPNVEAVLKLYTGDWSAGRETMETVVRSWRPPPAELHYRGQLAAVDDCLHRYGWLSHYVAFDDLDELMIPLQHANWSALIAERERVHPGKAAFMFRCSVMNGDHSSPARGFRDDALRYGSSVLSLTQRDAYVFLPSIRSKVIVNPRKVDTMAVHSVFKGSGVTDVIPVEQGLLYHYRWRPIRLCEPEVKDDRVAAMFGERLTLRLRYVWSRLKGVELGWQHPLERTDGIRWSCFRKAKEQKRRKTDKQNTA
ncbi:hypothetical protein EGW08_019849 [Elysia chlorotica]|uniref:Glycosyltransferase family 92 protein n=1 Tax=Elysia chlorotica TaxID=188477 RepID=A0A433STB3_ELYCH|nr:hypothetical protein EGW08_019849 [Elysia chlorotica]